ncbi:SDR family NAD(P)-dependent oxidoreductase [Streptomyces lunaelactis]|uniref:SDR family NAD(P)-dependent oxidoreductase n=1 Tax=Streptomyces lunaelactis TaxID=1535768 RepID=UPI0015844898|nr:SDR family NAD(P)-dependent oxidoreductase [Streptomyces lunaelactis]NUK05251.1 SDR family NAD(P)-dependent oxidoreductase [Streptomyces lunaelactis]NUK11663.1 SDR family NAD(P)-dependent oxidoreductase [Streptomyces lunaelactis]NUK19332.1 SDR family NAD(P)-dependent oxidoreductase [Streptomyces lunaelactis]NUK26217.1 SDR family NAD(P)-dependent oxidoreductase [Streptomyces lunaelactis]NUK34880.1 SDR family NAD(P)-dependent oxidoreductase [Streptomyces lunaelactis]
MAQDLQGRTAVVTGASKGIGLAVTQALAAAGAQVVAAARSSSPDLDALVKTGNARWVPLDLTEPGSADSLVAATGPRIDVLVNNVGSAPARPGGFLSVPDAQWRQTFELNLFAAVAVTRAVLPVMLEAGAGSIVNVGSVNAELPDPTVVDYSAAKAALAGELLDCGRSGEDDIRPGPRGDRDGVASSAGAVLGAFGRRVVPSAAGTAQTRRPRS